MIDQLYLTAQGADNRYVLGLRIGVNDADELKPMHRTSLRQPDTHVAGGGFNHRIASLQPPVSQSAFDHVSRGPVFGAATGVQRLDLGDQINILAVEIAGQAHHRRLANKVEHIVRDPRGREGVGVGFHLSTNIHLRSLSGSQVSSAAQDRAVADRVASLSLRALLSPQLEGNGVARKRTMVENCYLRLNLVGGIKFRLVWN